MNLRYRSYFRISRLPGLAILLIALVYLATDFSHHNWTRTNPANRGVIKNDINMYYAYLTAGIIEKDLKLDFISEPGFKNKYRYWNSKTESGNRIIITSMGLAFLYAPFFLTAHLLANVFGLPTDGYGSIYQFFLIFGGFCYAILGFLILNRLLRKWFDPVIRSVTLILIAIGTNLYYYATYEAAMSHVHNFFLITLFLLQITRWYSKPDWKNAILTGGLLGLISLVRPTNILVFLLLFFWDVKNFREFTERILFYLNRYFLVLIMMAAFIVAWTPQMLYWKMVTGKFLYFSYGVAGASFYFAHPQILGSLFSFIKGWYVYTPLMFFATLGIIWLRRRIPSLFLPVLFLLIMMIYVQSSWWSWWFGGGYGLRAYVDIYGVMAIPLAVLTEQLLRTRRKWLKIAGIVAMLFLVYLSWHQTYQYHKGMIHYCGMSKESYKVNFLKFKSAPSYWESLELPDHTLARQGIYYYYSTEKNKVYSDLEKDAAIDAIKQELKADGKLSRQVVRYADREELEKESAFEYIATHIFKYYTKEMK